MHEFCQLAGTGFPNLNEWQLGRVIDQPQQVPDLQILPFDEAEYDNIGGPVTSDVINLHDNIHYSDKTFTAKDARLMLQKHPLMGGLGKQQLVLNGLDFLLKDERVPGTWMHLISKETANTNALTDGSPWKCPLCTSDIHARVPLENQDVRPSLRGFSRFESIVVHCRKWHKEVPEPYRAELLAHEVDQNAALDDAMQNHLGRYFEGELDNLRNGIFGRRVRNIH